MRTWILYAILSIIFAGLTFVLAKYDLQNISAYIEAMDDKLEVLKSWMIAEQEGKDLFLTFFTRSCKYQDNLS